MGYTEVKLVDTTKGMFMSKWDLFTNRFKVPRLTGIFTEEK